MTSALSQGRKRRPSRAHEKLTAQYEGPYRELRGLSLEALIQRFNAPCPEGKEYAAGYYLEIGYLIWRTKRGARFLLQQLGPSDPDRVRAAVFALGLKTRSRNTVPMLLRFSRDTRPMVRAEAIDGLRHNRYRKALKEIRPLCSHKNPYVVGAAFRYVSAFDRKRAIPLLLDALRRPNQIIRQNACDLLEELGAVDAIPSIIPLVRDRNPFTRDAAKWAVRSLLGRLPIFRGLTLGQIEDACRDLRRCL